MTISEGDIDAQPATQPRGRARVSRRRWIVALAVFLVALGIAYALVCNYLERKLEGMIASKLNAELRIHGLLYFPPYQIRLSGADLVRRNNVILNVGRVHLKLAESPFGDDPVVIEQFDVREPIVRVIRTREGLQGGPGLVKEDVKQEPEPRKKFSDFLRLRRFRITGGQIVYDDDTTPYGRDVTWRGIDVQVLTARKGPALYTWELTFGNGTLGDGSAAGSIDVDALVLALDRFHLGVHVDPQDSESPLPAALQKLLKEHAVAGRLGIDGKAAIHFRELGKSTYEGTIELSDGALAFPKWNAGFDDADIRLRLATTAAAARGPSVATAPATTQASVPAMVVGIGSVRIGSGRAALLMSGGELIVDPAAGSWQLREVIGKLHAAENVPPPQAGAVRNAVEEWKLSGTVDFTAAAEGPLKPDPSQRLTDAIRHELLLYPHGLSLQPKDWPESLRDIGGGVVRIADGEATGENLSALYGKDQWLLRTARIPLTGVSRSVLISDLSGSIDFHPPSPEYPRALRATVRALAPSGEFPIAGSMEVDLTKPRGQRAQYDLIVSSASGAFALTPRRIPVTMIRGSAAVRREGPIGTVEIKRFDGDSLGGTVSAKATFITTSPRSWAGTATVRDVDLEKLSRFVRMPEEEEQKLTGRAFANVKLSGETRKETVIDSLRGRGQMEVLDGDFFRLPVLAEVTAAVTGDGGNKMGTVGEAAILFDVDGRTIHLRDAALSAPLLGIQGGGWLTTDGRLDLDLVAAPLADWRDKLKQTNIPLVSDITGEVAGAIQRALNAVTRQLLYEFRVTGTVIDPQIKTVPAPALDEAHAIFFGNMLNRPRDRRLIDYLRAEDAGK